MATTLRIDLTGFGFTKTESLAYETLLEAGPSSGYAVGKTLGIARANAYQALNGLVTKGAATLVEGEPQLFRALDPESLLALLVQRETAKLDLLERQVKEVGGGPEQRLVEFRGMRQLTELALRTVTRAQEEVTCLAPSPVLEALRPIWRKRLADGSPTKLVSVGPASERPDLAIAHQIEPDDARPYFPSDPLLLVTGRAAIVGVVEPEPAGYWTSDPIWRGAARGTLDHLTG